MMFRSIVMIAFISVASFAVGAQERNSQAVRACADQATNALSARIFGGLPSDVVSVTNKATKLRNLHSYTGLKSDWSDRFYMAFEPLDSVAKAYIDLKCTGGVADEDNQYTDALTELILNYWATLTAIEPEVSKEFAYTDGQMKLAYDNLFAAIDGGEDRVKRLIRVLVSDPRSPETQAYIKQTKVFFKVVALYVDTHYEGHNTAEDVKSLAKSKYVQTEQDLIEMIERLFVQYDI